MVSRLHQGSLQDKLGLGGLLRGRSDRLGRKRSDAHQQLQAMLEAISRGNTPFFIAWVALLGYVPVLARRQARVEAGANYLKELVQEREQAEGKPGGSEI